MQLQDLLNDVIKVVEDELNRQKTENHETLLRIEGAATGVRYFLDVLNQKIKELPVGQQNSQPSEQEKNSGE